MKKKAVKIVLCLMVVLMVACNIGNEISEPAPTGPVEITLGPNGGDGYENLADAVSKVPAGSAIRLEAGIFRLEQPLWIDKEISLIGAGVDLTKVISSAGDYVITFDGAAPFRAYDITFSYEGSLPGDVIVVESGEVLFNNCRFLGARTAEGDEVYRAGVALLGNTVGNIQGCEFTNNSYGVGVETDASSQVLLEGNTLHHNAFAGIKYFEQAGGLPGTMKFMRMVYRGSF